MGDEWGDAGDGYAYGHGESPAGRRRLALHPAMIGLVAVALFALGFLAYLASAGRMETDGDDPASQGEGGPGTDGEVAAGDPSTTGAQPAGQPGSTGEAGGEPARFEAPDGAYVAATLDLDAGPAEGLFTLSGRVPDEETARALTQAAELSYAPFVESDLEVDESLDPAPWLATSPGLIGLLPSITDGTILVAGGEIQLTGRSPNPEYLALLEGALGQLSGLPVSSDVEVTDLASPRFSASVDRGDITLAGEVPSEQVVDILAGGAAAAYGAGNVTNQLTVDAGTYLSFWMYTMPGVFQLFVPFPSYELEVDQGITTGAIHGGVLFAFDSTEITDEMAQVLNVGVAVMARDRSIYTTVEGHTDADGAAGYNDELSMERAQSVVDYFVGAGIDEERLQAVGAGESEPLASNGTDAGRAANRRVEFLFGPGFDTPPG